MEEAPRAINQEECLSPASFRHLVAVLRSFFIGFQSERQIFCREALKCATCVCFGCLFYVRGTFFTNVSASKP